MSTLNNYEVVFISAAFLYQFLLLLNFVGRNFRPVLERKYGWILYALSVPALITGGIYLLAGQPWYYILALALFALWGGFGYYIDIYRKVKWRNPTRAAVMIPYVVLYMGSQFAFWIPLWYLGMTYWWVFTGFYAVNTVLNIVGHRGFSKTNPSGTSPAL